MGAQDISTDDILAGHDPNDPVTAYGVGHIPTTYTSYLSPEGLRDTRVGVIREPMAGDTNPDAEDFREVRPSGWARTNV